MPAEAALGCSGERASPGACGSEGQAQPGTAATPSSRLPTPLGRALGLSHGWVQPAVWAGCVCRSLPCSAVLPAPFAASLAFPGAAGSANALLTACSVGAAPSQSCPSCWLRR